MSWLLLMWFAANPPSFPSASMSLSAVQKAWTPGQRLAIETPQAFRIGLLDSGLLAELNRYRWAPVTTDGRFDPSAVSQFWVGERFVMAFDRRGRLRFALLRFSVPIDTRRDLPDRWSDQRLRRRAATVQRLTGPLGLVPDERDRFGNVFGWRGRARGVQARLRHEPTLDEMYLLLKY